MAIIFRGETSSLNRSGDLGSMVKIKKDKLKVNIRTLREKIEGVIHKNSGDRLLDMMNKKSEPFIAVSDATICSASDGRMLYQTNFIAVNVNHVVHISRETILEEKP